MRKLIVGLVSLLAVSAFAATTQADAYNDPDTSAYASYCATGDTPNVIVWNGTGYTYLKTHAFVKLHMDDPNGFLQWLNGKVRNHYEMSSYWFIDSNGSVTASDSFTPPVTGKFQFGFASDIETSSYITLGVLCSRAV